MLKASSFKRRNFSQNAVSKHNNMKTFLAILIVIGTQIIYSHNDSTVVNILYDTIKVKQNDSSFVKIISVPKSTWIYRNEGAILGAFLASLVAIITVYLTHRSNRKLRIEKEKKIYYGLLFSLKIEFNSQTTNVQSLLQELLVIKNNSISANEIISIQPPRNLSLSFLKEVRNKFLNSEIFTTNILFLVSKFINKSQLINSNIKFERLLNISEIFKESIDYKKVISVYFDAVIMDVEELQKSIPEIISGLTRKKQLM